jgi:hypothetical protein
MTVALSKPSRLGAPRIVSVVRKTDASSLNRALAHRAGGRGAILSFARCCTRFVDCF